MMEGSGGDPVSSGPPTPPAPLGGRMLVAESFSQSYTKKVDYEHNDDRAAGP
jgi:hypothetical protein